MALPSTGMEVGDGSRHHRVWVKCSPLQPSMCAMMVKIGLEIEQFAFEIGSGPEQRTIQALSAEGTDQPLHKGVGQGNIGGGLDLGHLQDPQVGLPPPNAIEWIKVGAEVLGHPALPSNCVVEHPAKSDTADGTGLDAEPQDAAGKLIHDNQDQVSSQRGRFAPEQVSAPEAVVQVAKESQPGWTTRVLSRSVATGENPSNRVIVDGDVESEGNLLSDARTAPRGIALLHLDDGVDEFFVGSPGSGLASAFRGENQAVLALGQDLVKAQKGRRLQHDGRTDQPRRPQK